MPFGLKNAPATFQRLMNLVLIGLLDVELLVYLDDVIVFAATLEEHDKEIRKLFDRLLKAKLSLQSDKCEFLSTEVEYLGHSIKKDGYILALILRKRSRWKNFRGRKIKQMFINFWD